MGKGFTPGSGATAAMDEVGSASAPSSGQQIPYAKLDYGAAGASAPVGVSTPLPTADPHSLISVTLTLDTSAYASGDLLADTQAITGATLATGAKAELVSLMVVDEDDQGVAFDVYVTSSSSSWGTENAAPTISDATARSIQAIIPVATADYKDLGGVRVANIKNIMSVCQSSGAADLYVAVVNGSGTPTFTATGVKLIFGFRLSN